MKNLSRNNLIVIAAVAVLVIAGTAWWALNRESDVEVDFTLTFTSGVGCSFQHPQLGLVTGQVDLILRDSDDAKVATVTMHKASSGSSGDCVMIGMAEIPVKDVYRVYVDNLGTTLDAGFIDRGEVESGNVRITNP